MTGLRIISSILTLVLVASAVAAAVGDRGASFVATPKDQSRLLVGR